MKQEARPGDGLESPGFSRGEEVNELNLTPGRRAGTLPNPRLAKNRSEPLPFRP